LCSEGAIRIGAVGGRGGLPCVHFCGYFADFVVLDSWVAVGEGSNSVFWEPCRLPCAFEGDGKDEGVLVFRAHAG